MNAAELQRKRAEELEAQRQADEAVQKQWQMLAANEDRAPDCCFYPEQEPVTSIEYIRGDDSLGGNVQGSKVTITINAESPDAENRVAALAGGLAKDTGSLPVISQDEGEITIEVNAGLNETLGAMHSAGLLEMDDMISASRALGMSGKFTSGLQRPSAGRGITA